VGGEQWGDGEQGAVAVVVLDLEIEATSWRTSCHRHRRFLLASLLERDVDDASID